MTQSHELCFFDSETYQEDTFDDITDSFESCNNITTKINKPENILLQPLFNLFLINIIKKNCQLSTLHARTSTSLLLRKTYRSTFTVSNVKCRSETVAADTIYSDSPAIDDGSTYGQLFVGTKTLVTDAYGMKSEKNYYLL